MSEELKPCPWCNSENICPSVGQLIRPGGVLVDWYIVECFECKVQMDGFNSKEKAITAWNKRVGNE